MDELQAAFLTVKLKYLDSENDLRRRIAEYYSEQIKNERIILPTKEQFDDSHVQHLYVIRTKERDRLQAHLADNRIQTQIHYPIPPHKQECYKEWNELSFPVTEQIHREVLTLPISPAMAQEEVEAIVNTINNWMI